MVHHGSIYIFFSLSGTAYEIYPSPLKNICLPLTYLISPYIGLVAKHNTLMI